MPSAVPQTRAAKTGKGHDRVHFAPLAAVEEKHFCFTSRRSLIAGLGRRIAASLAPGYRVLEIGCGTGNVLGPLKAACPRGSVFGMDLFSEGLSFVASRGRQGLLQADAHRPPFRVEFD